MEDGMKNYMRLLKQEAYGEYQSMLEEIEHKGVAEAVSRAREISLKQDILHLFDVIEHEEEARLLVESHFPLDLVYQECRSSDPELFQIVKDCLACVINILDSCEYSSECDFDDEEDYR